MRENPEFIQRGYLKKQSQFAPAQVGAKSFMKGNYDNKSAGGDEKNKPKQSQFLYRRPDSSFIILSMPDAGSSMLAGYRETRNKNRDTRI